MVKKLSETKVSKIFNLYFQGYSQTAIGNRLKIDQSTVSLRIGEFKALAEQQGILAAAEEYGVMDEVQTLYDLAVDLKKGKLTAEEAETGLKMVLMLQKYGVEQEEYGNLIQACQKMKDESFLPAAMELNKLETGTGLSYKELITEYKSTYDQFVQGQKELDNNKAKIKATTAKITEINKQKNQASQDLKAHMKKIGVDEQRLKAVEALALTLKKAGISNQELDEYVKRQELLNKTGVSIKAFTDILEKSKVVISGDNGKQLVDMLSEYGGLNTVINKLEVKKTVLTDEVSTLEAQAKLKGKLEVEVKKLKSDKANLEANIAQLHEQEKDYAAKIQQKKYELSQVTNSGYAAQQYNEALNHQKINLENEVTERQKYRDNIDKEIKESEQQLSKLKEQQDKLAKENAELESKQKQLLKDNTEIEAKLNQNKRTKLVYESFLGFVQSSTLEGIEKFAPALPFLIEDAKKGKYSPDFLKEHILRKFSDFESLQVFECTYCHMQFIIYNHPNKISSVKYCPRCSLPNLIIAQDVTVTLKKALEPQKAILVKSVPPQKPKNSGVEKSQDTHQTS